jgi:ABC-type glycerol-3-phosphate transport system permease component
MFTQPGGIGIFCVAVVAGFYFARFFDARRELEAAEFVSLLTVIGLGPTALALIRAYRDLNLLDPYGVGLLAGVLLNVALALLLRALPAERRGEVARSILTLTGHLP